MSELGGVVIEALGAFEAHEIDKCVDLLTPLVESTFIPALMLLRTLRLSYPQICVEHGLLASAESITRRVNEAPDDSYATMEEFLTGLPAESKSGVFLRASWLSFARGDAKSAHTLYSEVASTIPSAKVNVAAYIENNSDNGAEAFRMYTEVTEADGHAMAQYNRAIILMNGKYGIVADVPQSLKILEDLAGAKLSVAQYTLGMWKLNNKVPGGLELLKNAAEQGHERAMLTLGECYHTGKYGDEIPKNPEMAVKYYDSAAREGNADAQYYLATCYQEGFGVKEQDLCEAAILLHLAAEQGHAGAQLQLGICYKTGKGVPVNHTTAAKLFEAAAEKGKTVAMCNLAMCYKSGKGVEKSEVKCRELFEKAAALGDVNAKRFLETMK